jgi:hypothetical protein
MRFFTSAGKVAWLTIAYLVLSEGLTSSPLIASFLDRIFPRWTPYTEIVINILDIFILIILIAFLVSKIAKEFRSKRTISTVLAVFIAIVALLRLLSLILMFYISVTQQIAGFQYYKNAVKECGKKPIIVVPSDVGGVSDEYIYPDSPSYDGMKYKIGEPGIVTYGYRCNQ